MCTSRVTLGNSNIHRVLNIVFWPIDFYPISPLKNLLKLRTNFCCFLPCVTQIFLGDVTLRLSHILDVRMLLELQHSLPVLQHQPLHRFLLEESLKVVTSCRWHWGLSLLHVLDLGILFSLGVYIAQPWCWNFLALS